MTSRSEMLAEDITALLRARNPLLWVVTREEARVESYLIEAAAAAGYVPLMWDCGQGVTDMAGAAVRIGNQDPGETITTIMATSQNPSTPRRVWIMRDLPPWLQGPIGMTTCRQLRNLARKLPELPRDNAQSVIVLSPSGDVPPELAGHATVLDWPLPDREEITAILDGTIENLPDNLKEQAAPNGTRDAAIDAAIGLSGEEAQACYARSLVQLQRIDPTVVAGEKKRIIARERILEWFDPLSGGLNAVGGLDKLKTWLVQRKTAYSPAAREYGLPTPKGALLVGIPGCGKSLTAKAISTAWGIPLLRIDLGALKSKFVGESEANLRRALRVIEAIGRCVVWLDEVEKALAGATQGAADGGVSSDALGAILNWMQERAGEAFVVATANDVTTLPPELLRKGRFDEVWWVDLPTQAERVEILAASLRRVGHSDAKINPEKVAAACDGFTGSEIADALVPDALFTAFGDGKRALATNDLLASAKTITPLSKTMAERITSLRDWAQGRARNATSQQAAATMRKPAGRALDL